MTAPSTSATRVTPELRVRAKTIDAALVGARIRTARQRAGLTQGQAAGDTMSTAYLSRIESGHRRASADLLVALADRVGCDPDELLDPEDTATADRVAELVLELDYAELDLRTGSGEAALARIRAVLAAEELTTELSRRGRLLHAFALESVGRVERAVDVLEEVVDELTGVELVKVLTALSRCYRELGDLNRAVEVGDRAEELLGAAGLDGSAEGVQLAVTVAAAQHERGDVNMALRTCERAVEAAERLGSPMARAAAYWNSSIVHKRRGDVSAALTLAQRAIALLEQTHDARMVARLRGQLGLLQLALDPPELEGAVLNLTQARAELDLSAANVADRGRVDLGLARARLLIGDDEEAERLAEDTLESAHDVSLLVAAEARTLLGQVAAARDDLDGAVEHFRRALVILDGVGMARDAAQLWFELGALLQQHGAVEDALDAFRRAATSSGLTQPTYARSRLFQMT